jgi:hypothetical protein
MQSGLNSDTIQQQFRAIQNYSEHIQSYAELHQNSIRTIQRIDRTASELRQLHRKTAFLALKQRFCHELTRIFFFTTKGTKGGIRIGVGIGISGQHVRQSARPNWADFGLCPKATPFASVRGRYSVLKEQARRQAVSKRLVLQAKTKKKAAFHNRGEPARPIRKWGSDHKRNFEVSCGLCGR